MDLDEWLVTAAAFAVAALLTGLVRGFALAHGVLDIPNMRSSHSAPTPRGGGVAIVIAVLAGVAVMYARGRMPTDLAVAALAGGLVVAVVGFIDDLRSVSPALRLIAQFAAFAWCVCRLGLLPPVDFGFDVLDLGVAGSVAGVIFLVWFLNLYNFMDGIDGIASVEVISVMLFAAFLVCRGGAEFHTVFALLLVAGAAAGFLMWNWPPARIFMGDAGSGFLGFIVGAIAWDTLVRGQLTIWVWLIMLGLFIVDATLTMLRRWRRGANPAEAHRSHAYQRLSRKYGSHLKVTLGVLLVNIVWLDPLAYAAMLRPSWGAALAGLSWLPLAIAAWRIGAGTEER